ncbi:MAG: hypothetical protein ABI626_10810 [Sphingomicrobium sp.]
MKPSHLVLAASGLFFSPALALSPAAAQGAVAPSPSRGVVQTVTSTALPRLTVRVDPSLHYIGRGEGVAMQETARYERFLFGEVKHGKLLRAAIVHFEEMIPGKDGGAFNYPRFRMATVGGEEYLHQIWPMPTNDVLNGEDLRALLTAGGIKAEGAWLVGRYARAVDAANQHEILIFLHGVGRGPGQLGGSIGPSLDEAARAGDRRSQSAGAGARVHHTSAGRGEHRALSR